MFKIKNLTILALITVASIGNIYSIDSLIDDEGRKSKGHHHGKEVKHEQESKSHHGGVYIAKHRYGRLDDNKNNSSIVEALKSHPATQRGAALLHSLTATKTTSTTTTSTTPPYDIRWLIDGSGFNYSGTSTPLSATLFAVYNQGNLGSCTANAGAGAMQYCQIRDSIIINKILPANVVPFVPSRLFLYWNERFNSGGLSNTTADNGATMSDIIYALVNNGVCRENPSSSTDNSYWPYSDQTVGSAFSPFKTGTPFTQQPSTAAINAAKSDTDTGVTANSSALNNETNITNSVATAAITGSTTIPTGSTISPLVASIKTTLFGNNPVLFSIDVYSSFESAATDSSGYVPIPNTQTETLLGGHALMMVGYNDSLSYTYGTGKGASKLTGFFTVRNSWGTSVGNQGYYYFPYSYINNANLAGNFYMVTKTSL